MRLNEQHFIFFNIMKKYLKILLFITSLIIIFVFLNFGDLYEPREQVKMSGHFLIAFNISGGEYQEIPSNITEKEIIAAGYEFIQINDTVLESYPSLKAAIKENKKTIELTDEEATIIIRNLNGKVIEFNKNYYLVTIAIS